MRDPDRDWDPRDPSVLRDQVGAYHQVRERCPIAHSEYLGWSVLRQLVQEAGGAVVGCGRLT